VSVRSLNLKDRSVFRILGERRKRLRKVLHVFTFIILKGRAGAGGLVSHKNPGGGGGGKESIYPRLHKGKVWKKIGESHTTADRLVYKLSAQGHSTTGSRPKTEGKQKTAEKYDGEIEISFPPTQSERDKGTELGFHIRARQLRVRKSATLAFQRR